MKALVFSILTLVLLGFAAQRAYLSFEAWGDTPRSLSQETVLELKRGSGLSRLAEQLAEQDLVSSARAFEFWVRLFSDYSKFQAGTYRFEDRVSPGEIAAKISSGEVYAPVVLQFTIPEGFTLDKTIKRLAALEVETEEELWALVRDSDFLRSLKVEGKTLEGFVYPATYSFLEKPTAKEAFTRAVTTFFEKLPSEYKRSAKARGLTLREAVTFASLIELETSLDEERSLVSEVIWNRLQKKIALAIDASVIYGVKNYNGNLTRAHLKDRSNPYNTRVHGGLPPGPIGSPSLASLNAVLTPSDKGNFYYVRGPELTKAHRFSKTLSEHNRNVRQYVKAERQARRRR